MKIKLRNREIEFITFLEDNKNYSIFEHFKSTTENKMTYRIICIGIDSESDREMIIYEALYDNKIWIRNVEEFFSEFDKTKYPNSIQKYRFEKIN